MYFINSLSVAAATLALFSTAASAMVPESSNSVDPHSEIQPSMRRTQRRPIKAHSNRDRERIYRENHNFSPAQNAAFNLHMFDPNNGAPNTPHRNADRPDHRPTAVDPENVDAALQWTPLPLIVPLPRNINPAEVKPGPKAQPKPPYFDFDKTPCKVYISKATNPVGGIGATYGSEMVAGNGLVRVGEYICRASPHCRSCICYDLPYGWRFGSVDMRTSVRDFLRTESQLGAATTAGVTTHNLQNEGQQTTTRADGASTSSSAH